MIKNLPKKTKPSILSSFDLGESEAIDDKLLANCFCNIEPISTFTNGNYEILYGGKGAGKTAVFKLIQDKKITFANKNKLNQIIIPINQDLEYCSIKAILSKNLTSTIDDEDTQYRFIWEVYLLYRISVVMLEKFKTLPDDLSKKIKDLLGNFRGEEQTPTILKLITSTKRTVGFKLNYTNPSFPTPDFYLSAEPTKDGNPEREVNVHTFQLEEFKDKLNRFLVKQNSIIFVLLDNIDDFVAKEAYEEQKKILQGLISCSRSYSKFPAMKPKLFLRTELFRALNFSLLGGYDKIEPKAIELRWGHSDIRQFIAQRLLYNLTNIFKLKGLQFDVDENELYGNSRYTNHESLFDLILDLVAKFFPGVALRYKRDQHDGRSVNLDDHLSQTIITTIFPRQIDHINSQGREVRDSFFTFIDTHFTLSNKETTPRIILLYLKKVIAHAIDYYRKNFDEEIRLNERYEYPLIKRSHITSAYKDLQRTIIPILVSSVTNDVWAKKCSILLLKVNRKQVFTYKAIKSVTQIEDDDELHDFIAYLTHIGIFFCRDKSVSLTHRVYDIPILLTRST